MKLLKLVFTFIGLSSLATSQLGCNPFSVKDLSGNTVALRSRSPAEQRIKAMKTAMVALAQKFPSDEDMALAETEEGYQQVIRQIFESEGFANAIQLLAMNDFEMGGTIGGINYSEAANLAAYLVSNNLDYRQILTADYCVDDDLKKVSCSAFASPAQTQSFAAGAVTTQGFMEKWQAAFNFRRVAKMFKVFACKEYPDNLDPGLAQAQLPETLKTFACTDCVPKCYDCHKSMNPRAVLFYSFDRKGKYNTSPNPNPNAGEITVTDTNKASSPKDIVIDGTTLTYKGTPVTTLREYASLFSKGEDFRNCTAQRFVGRLFGLSAEEELPESLEHFYEGLEADDFKIKDFIFRVVTSKEFLSR